MRLKNHSIMARLVALILLLSHIVCVSGCSTIVSGSDQTVRIKTYPAGRTVYYQGQAIKDGELLTVNKKFQKPQFNVGRSHRPVMVDMQYSPDAWLLGDAGLALFFLLPGLIAGGIDAGTGAWRNLDNPQYVFVQD